MAPHPAHDPAAYRSGEFWRKAGVQRENAQSPRAAFSNCRTASTCRKQVSWWKWQDTC